jgi:regulator of nonsense transcripts 1
MHPSISEWPNKSFYEGKLEDHTCVLSSEDGEISAIFPGVTPDRRVVFIDTDGLGSEELVGTSTRNLSECKILGAIVERFIGTNKVKMNQIGVIVPYLAQKQVLISELKKRNLLSGIQINTVEGFQGHEKDYIIISTTRSNAAGVLGFIEDDRRMNVMLTRARKGLIVVGDQQTLKRGNRWSQWLEWCKSNGTVITAKKFHGRKM